MTNDIEPKHGKDGWGLEKYSRDTIAHDNGDGTVTIEEIGHYLYERAKPFETRIVHRTLGVRTVAIVARAS